MLKTILSKTKSPVVLMLFFLTVLIAGGSLEVIAQRNTPPTLQTIESDLQTQTTSVKSIVGYIIYAVLIISLIWVIWAVATGSPSSKGAVVSFVAAIIIWIIFFNVF